MTKQADFKRRVRARMARTGESYAAARGQLLDTPPAGDALVGDALADALHVTNGDATDLPGTGLARRVVYWRDVLHEGPVPAVGADELRAIRAAFLGGADPGRQAAIGAQLAEREAALADNRDGGYLLWFEADLYDQLQIVQVLARLADLDVPAERIWLICIGEHPGIARFGGLGELTAEQLRALPATDVCARLTPAALALATQAWAAFRAPVPDGLRAVAAGRSAELRFLGEAFDRLGREYPGVRDGLSLTERRILAAVADGAAHAGVVDAGVVDAGGAFVRAAARETRPFLGDTWCFATMDRLAAGPSPLLEVAPPGPVDRHTGLRLTGDGARVLAGAADQVELNGIDRWIGGVQLTGRRVRWRWDDGTETLVGGPLA